MAEVYLETTMLSFYYEERQQEEYIKLKSQVRQIFDLIAAGKFEPYTSTLATDEIDNEPNQKKREKMWQLIADYNIAVLPSGDDEVTALANFYLQEGAVPLDYLTDAKHIAVATVNGLDFIVSLNFAHIARQWTVERVRRVNTRHGYQAIGIYKPVEVLDL